MTDGTVRGENTVIEEYGGGNIEKGIPLSNIKSYAPGKSEADVVRVEVRSQEQTATDSSGNTNNDKETDQETDNGSNQKDDEKINNETDKKVNPDTDNGSAQTDGKENDHRTDKTSNRKKNTETNKDNYKDNYKDGADEKNKTSANGEKDIKDNAISDVEEGVTDDTAANSEENTEEDAGLSPYRAFLENSVLLITQAPQGAGVVIDCGDYHTLPLWYMKEIEKRRDLTIRFEYKYRGMLYNVPIPAGAEIGYQEDIRYYGPLKLFAMFGGVRTRIS